MNREFTHKALGLKLAIKPLTQGMVEDYFAAFRELAPRERSSSEAEGAAVRAALKAEWLEEPKLTLEQIKGLDPRHVRWYASKIDQVYTEATTIPPE